MTRAALGTIILLAMQTFTSAAILNVPDQYTTIQAAIEDANDGDTVMVNPGTYMENIYFYHKNIILTSQDPSNPEIVASTIINGLDQSSVVIFAGQETPDAVLTGFTITGGYGMIINEFNPNIIWGAGIFCVDSSPTIKNNVVVNNISPELNQVESYGGGIACLASNAVITNNIIRDNYAIAGGGILNYAGNAIIANNLIYDNSAIVGGGAILLGGRLVNNTIVRNRAENGGNVYLLSEPEEMNYTVLNNIICQSNSESIFRETVYENDVVAFNNIWDNYIGSDAVWFECNNTNGNISENPMFIDPESRDFRLQMDSPCINAGKPDYTGNADNLDIYGNSRFKQGRIDMGAAEYDGNIRPVADAGDDQSIDNLSDTITLDGSGSFDPDGNTNLVYHWSQVAGPDVHLQNIDKAIAKFTPTEFGAYKFELTVGDGLLESVSDDVIVTVDDGVIPVADAGLPVYVADDAVVLNGTKSYDPDDSGELYYSWRQIAGPVLVMTDANSPTPTIDGFIRTDSVQVCQFELTVYDGQYESVPDTVNLYIIPNITGRSLYLENDFFDVNKPTIIYLSGGDCYSGGGSWNSPPWEEGANILSFSYRPDVPGVNATYYLCGDMVIQYLSTVAPDYHQPVQTMGHSTGGQVCIDIAKQINITYKDPRYAVNRISFLDARCRSYSANIVDLLANPVDGEQFWIDTYEGGASIPLFYNGILNIKVAVNTHSLPPIWYKNSLTNDDFNQFNGGIVGGAYWSLIGPGKNLQLATEPFKEIYKFDWIGTQNAGRMELYDAANFPAKLPEPVTLIGPVNNGELEGALLSCRESENAIGYQLLFGTDPYRVMDYIIASDTQTPPNEVINSLPFENCWWTIRAYDQYGSTIHADPKPVNMFNLTLPITNMSTGKRYGYIQEAVDEANIGDKIVLAEGTYIENVDIRKNITIRSTNPDNPAVVEATIIKGLGEGSVVTLTDSVDSSCHVSGLTITGSVIGVHCINAKPTITNCIVKENKGTGVKLWDQSDATIVNCLIVDNNKAGIELYQVPARVPNSATIINCTIARNLQQGIWSGRPTVTNSIVYFNNTQIDGNLAAVAYSDIQGSFNGPGNIDTDPLFADPASGDYHLKSQAGRWNPLSQSWVQDEVTSPCIDTGDPESDIGLETEPNGSIINMGAYGGTIQASKSL